jgi:hypothetical protein
MAVAPEPPLDTGSQSTLERDRWRRVSLDRIELDVAWPCLIRASHNLAGSDVSSILPSACCSGPAEADIEDDLYWVVTKTAIGSYPT